MTYIKLEDALDFADFFHYCLTNAERKEVEEEFKKRNIPAIDPIGILDDMIAWEKEQLKTYTDLREIRDSKTCIRILVTAIEKIKSNQ